MKEWRKEIYLSHGLSTKTISTCKPKFIHDVSAIAAQETLSLLLFFHGCCCQSFPVTLVNSFRVPEVIIPSPTLPAMMKLWAVCSYDVIRQSLMGECLTWRPEGPCQ